MNAMNEADSADHVDANSTYGIWMHRLAGAYEICMKSRARNGSARRKKLIISAFTLLQSRRCGLNGNEWRVCDEIGYHGI